MKINVDRGRCTGIGICESIAPDHFEVGDDGELALLDASVAGADVGLIEQAVRSCPAKALSFTSAPATSAGASTPDGPT